MVEEPTADQMDFVPPRICVGPYYVVHCCDNVCLIAFQTILAGLIFLKFKNLCLELLILSFKMMLELNVVNIQPMKYELM